MVSSLLLFAACGGPPADTGVGGDDSAGSVDSGHEDTGSTDSDSDSATPPTDGDGDGFVAVEAGGDDCDDSDSTTWPGAEEWCDARDHDCDGEPLAPGVCGKVQSDVAVLRPVLKVDFSSQLFGGVSIVTDRTGDGSGDLLVACVDGCLASGASNGNLLYPGGLPAVVPTLPHGATHGWRASSEAAYAGYYALDPGDVDGDGIADLAFPMHGPLVGIHVFHGPFEQDGEIERIDEADALYTSDYGGASWGHPIVAGVDFDGDGRGDFAAGAFDEGTDVFWGGTNQYARLGWEGESPDMTSLGDIDGDGLTDLYTRFAWISGGDLEGADGAMPSALASGTWEFDETLWRVDGGQFKSLGDWDGDGYVEIAAGYPESSSTAERCGEVFFFGGDPRGLRTLDDTTGSLVGASVEGLGAYVHAADLDVDGIPDLVTLATYAKVWHVVPASAGVPPMRTSVHERSLEFSGMWLSNPGGDLSGDAGDDWLAATEAGVLGVFPGWPIPWDEPTWW